MSRIAQRMLDTNERGHIWSRSLTAIGNGVDVSAYEIVDRNDTMGFAKLACRIEADGIPSLRMAIEAFENDELGHDRRAGLR